MYIKDADRLFLCDEMKIITKDSDEILFFAKYPKWIIVEKGIGEIIRGFNGKTLAEIYSIISDEEISAVEELIRKGILIYEKDKLSNLPEKPTGIHYPIQGVWLNITSDCNLRCKHCFQGKKSKDEDLISAKEIEKLMEKILLFKGNKDIALDITGGEPLLRNDLHDIIKATNQKGFSRKIITNGLLLNTEVLSLLARENVRVQISLDGISANTHEFLRGKDTFQRTIDKIKDAVKAGVSVSLSMTVHSKNCHELNEYFSFAESIGVNDVNFSFISEIGSALTNGLTLKDEGIVKRNLMIQMAEEAKIRRMLNGSSLFRQIETVLRPIRVDCCGTGVNTCAVGATGNIYPCPSFQEDAFIFGNIRERSFDDIWTDQAVFGKFRQLDISDLNPVCSHCEVRYFCGGGCRAQAYYNSNKNLRAVGNKCRHDKGLYFDIIWLLNEYESLNNLEGYMA